MPRPQPKDDIRMINMTTREIYPTEAPEDNAAQWYKTTRRSMVNVLRILGDPKSAVLAELLGSMTYNNEVQRTMTEIAKAAGVSDKTVARVLTTLEKHGIVRRVRNGIFMIDPSVMRHGKNAFAGYAKQEWEKLT
jgi:predicted transcriptional regulator